MSLLEAPDYLHWSSIGKIVLAEVPEVRALRILEERRMPRITETTVTDPDELIEEFETIRERGYGLNDEEQIRGVRTVGAAVIDTDVLDAISVSDRTSRIDDEKFYETYPELVQTKNVIEMNLDTKRW